MNHTITLDSIPTMTVGELASLPASDLMSLSIKSDEQLKQAKLIKGWIDGALRLKYDEHVKQLRQSSGRDTGVVHFNDDNIKVTANLPKKVMWDQEKLKVLSEQLHEKGHDVDDFVEVTYNVPERRYTAWPKDMRELFGQARCFSYGKQTFKLAVKEDIA